MALIPPGMLPDGYGGGGAAGGVGTAGGGVAGWEQWWIKVGLIFLACLWVYSPVYDGEWLWDDDYLLTENAVVQSEDGLRELWLAPKTADYFPLTMTALWLQWKWFGLDSTGYHMVSIVLHGLGACGVWGLMVAMGLRGGWLGGLVFAVHPLGVESVAWISELKNTLSLPLLLGAVVCHVRHDATGRWGWWWGGLVLFVLAMLGKSSVVMWPVVMLLYAWWRRGRVGWGDVWRAAPFFAVSLVLGLVTLHFQHSRAIGDEPIPIGGAEARVAIAGMALLFYLGKIFWPSGLLPIYPQWDADPPDAWQLMPWLVVVGALGVFWWRRRSWGRHALMAGGWYGVMVLPVLGFVPMSYMRVGWVADHFVYVPMVGVVVFVVASGVRAYEWAGVAWRGAMLTGVAGVLVVLMVTSHVYAGVWVNEDRLWAHTLEGNHDSWQAHNRLGARKFNRGETEGALVHFREAVRLRPDLAETQNNLGSGLLAVRDTGGAVERFRRALELSPEILAIRANLGRALVLDGRVGEAARVYEGLVADYPGSATFWCNWGVTRYRLGDVVGAQECFRRALEIDPELQDARDNLRMIVNGED
jgi:protein O-mannosyl-transferase